MSPCIRTLRTSPGLPMTPPMKPERDDVHIRVRKEGVGFFEGCRGSGAGVKRALRSSYTPKRTVE